MALSALLSSEVGRVAMTNSPAKRCGVVCGTNNFVEEIDVARGLARCDGRAGRLGSQKCGQELYRALEWRQCKF